MSYDGSDVVWFVPVFIVWGFCLWLMFRKIDRGSK